jgi:hypothetical protein
MTISTEERRPRLTRKKKRGFPEPQKNTAPVSRRREYDSPKSMFGAYLPFFVDFLLLLADFFDEALDDFFDAAILLTTFHAVRDLPVAPTWQKAPAYTGKLAD